MKKILFLLLVTLSGFAQESLPDLDLDMDVILSGDHRYHQIHLNGYNLYLLSDSSLFVCYVFGSGAILADYMDPNDKAGLSICGYDCSLTPIQLEDFKIWSVAESCDQVLSLTEFSQDFLIRNARIKVYDLTGRLIMDQKYGACNILKHLKKHSIYILEIVTKDRRLAVKKIVF